MSSSRRFKEKEAAVFLERLVKLKVKSKDGVEIEENAAKNLKDIFCGQ